MYQKKSGRSAWLKYALALPVLIVLFVVFSGKNASANNGIGTKGVFINSYGEPTWMKHRSYIYGMVAQDLDMNVRSQNDYFLQTDKGGYISNVSFGIRNEEIKIEELTKRDKADDKPNSSSTEMTSPGPSCRLDDDGYAFFANDAFGLVGCGPGRPNMGCALDKIDELVESIKIYPEKAKRDGVQWRLFFELLVGKDGRPEAIRDVRDYPYPGDEYGFKLESIRIFEHIKDQLRFTPSICEGHPQKTKMAFAVNFKLSEADIEALPVKNSTTITPETRLVITGWGRDQVSFEYHSNMNVLTKYLLVDSDGNLIAEDEKRYFYQRNRNWMNHRKKLEPGKYTLIADQNGYLTKESFDIRSSSN